VYATHARSSTAVSDLDVPSLDSCPFEFCLSLLQTHLSTTQKASFSVYIILLVLHIY